MNTKTLIIPFVLSLIPGLGIAAPSTMSASTTTASTTMISTMTANGTSINASQVLPTGRYYGTIAPSFNPSMGKQLEKALALIPGVTAVAAHVDDSTLHFNVGSAARVQVADIQKLVSKAQPGAVISTPILEHSLALHPGL